MDLEQPVQLDLSVGMEMYTTQQQHLLFSLLQGGVEQLHYHYHQIYLILQAILSLCLTHMMNPLETNVILKVS